MSEKADIAKNELGTTIFEEEETIVIKAVVELTGCKDGIVRRELAVDRIKHNALIPDGKLEEEVSAVFEGT